MRHSGASRGSVLLAWFAQHRRDLPWRRTTDPYRIWVSEVMLQQTRVEAVLPYYQRFLDRFPTVGELAEAGIDEVLALWSGLGYYRRARQLHAAARQISASGEMPRTVERLLELPGVGAYTAAAVASIAFGVAVPVLDGNVERVMARQLALDGDTRRGAARQRLLAAAAALLDPSCPGDSNQALMELGATICLPRQPRCGSCPLRAECGAAREGDPERYPAPRRRRPTEIRWLLVVVAAAVGQPDRVLLYRRPAANDSAAGGRSPRRQEPLLAGTWELPWLELDREPRALPSGAAAALGMKYGGRWRLEPALAAVRHGITFRDLRVFICRAETVLAAGGGTREGTGAKMREGAGGEVREGAASEVREGAGGEMREGAASGWFDAAERAELPMSSLVGKALRACAAAAGRRPEAG